jgi:N-methylhydantoinase A
MANNVRSVSIERGYDPRDFTLFSYGGAGGLFLSAVCDEASVGEMLVPQNCAVFSAFGALMSDYRQTALRSIHWFVGTDHLAVAKVIDELEQEALGLAVRAGFEPGEVVLERAGDLRFTGQSTELPVPLPGGDVGEGYGATVEAAFLREYAREFGENSVWSGSPVELTGIRVTAVVPSKAYRPGTDGAAEVDAAVSAEPTSRRVFSPTRLEWADWQVYQRPELRPGMTIPGPVIIESADTTVVAHEGHEVTVDEFRNIIITNRAASRSED